MNFAKKVASSPNACLISLFFTGIPELLLSEGNDKFFTTSLSADYKEDLYVSSGSVKFSEQSVKGRSGIRFKQTITFILPTNDELRASRIHQFKKVKYVAITLSDKRELLFGRNDVGQNAKPKVQISSDEKLTQVKYTQLSWSPLGFLINESFSYQDGMRFLFQDGSGFNAN